MIRALLLMFCLSLVAADPAPDTTPPPAPALRQEQATGVLGRMVRDSDGKEIGRIVDVLVAPTGEPRAIVVDAGGYMGVGARRVAVAWDAVHVPPPGGTTEDVTIDMTDEQVRTAPSYTDRSKPATVVGPAVPASSGPAAPAPAPAPAPGPTSGPSPAAAPAPPPATK